MSSRVTNAREPSVSFDYDAIDNPQPTTVDQQFWAAQSELFGDVLRWLTTPRSLSRVGARCCALALYLNPELINKASLQEISRMRGAPGRAALSKAMLEFQRRYELNPAAYQKLPWMRERYRRSALVAHAERAQSQ